MIKSRKLKVIVSSCFAVGVAVGLYLATAELPTTHAQQGLDGRGFAAERTHEIGIQAYIYSYPMIMMEITRRVSTNVLLYNVHLGSIATPIFARVSLLANPLALVLVATIPVSLSQKVKNLATVLHYNFLNIGWKLTQSGN